MRPRVTYRTASNSYESRQVSRGICVALQMLLRNPGQLDEGQEQPFGSAAELAFGSREAWSTSMSATYIRAWLRTERRRLIQLGRADWLAR